MTLRAWQRNYRSITKFYKKYEKNDMLSMMMHLRLDVFVIKDLFIREPKLLFLQDRAVSKSVKSDMIH